MPRQGHDDFPGPGRVMAGKETKKRHGEGMKQILGFGVVIRVVIRVVPFLQSQAEQERDHDSSKWNRIPLDTVADM